MHCIRRVALKAACSSSRTIAAPRQATSIAAQISRVNAQSSAVLSLSRQFSWTPRVAQEQKDDPEYDMVDAIVDNAIASAEQKVRAARAASQFNPEGHGIYVGNVTFDATSQHLEEAFGKYGKITSASIVKDARGLSKGFGFVYYEDPQAVERAISEANSSFWHGRRIVVQPRTQTPGERPPRGRDPNAPSSPTTSLFIGNIPYESSDAELNQMFRALENVVDVRVAVDRNTGWPRGFAHADFVDVESAQKAKEYLSQQVLSGRQLRIDYSSPRVGAKVRGRGAQGVQEAQEAGEQ